MKKLFQYQTWNKTFHEFEYFSNCFFFFLNSFFSSCVLIQSRFDAFWKWLDFIINSIIANNIKMYFTKNKTVLIRKLTVNCQEHKIDIILNDAIYIYMHQVGFGRKREVFSMKEIHVESPFPCDYVRNGYCKRVITLTAESRRVFWGFY